MIHSRQTVRGREQVFICDACNREIEDRTEVRLLRNMYFLPEDPTVYYVHRRCAQNFVAEQGGGSWKRYRLTTREASWFLPLMSASSGIRDRFRRGG